MHENKKVVVLRCRHCGRIVASDELFEDKMLELQACPYCGSEILDPLNNNNNNNKEENKMPITADSTRTISIVQQIEIPDFTSAVTLTVEQLTDYASRTNDATAIIDKLFDIKIDGIRQWLQNFLQPFFEMSDEHFKKLFTCSVYTPIRNFTPMTENDCSYQVSVYPSSYGGKEFKVHLEVDNQEYLVYTFTKDKYTLDIKYIKAIKEDPVFLKGWEYYKTLIKTAMENHINNALERVKKETEEKETMADFISKFSI